MALLPPFYEDKRTRRVKRLTLGLDELLTFLGSLDGGLRYTQQGIPDDAIVVGAYLSDQHQAYPRLTILVHSETFPEVALDGFPGDLDASFQTHWGKLTDALRGTNATT